MLCFASIKLITRVDRYPGNSTGKKRVSSEIFKWQQPSSRGTRSHQVSVTPAAASDSWEDSAQPLYFFMPVSPSEGGGGSGQKHSKGPDCKTSLWEIKNSCREITETLVGILTEVISNDSRARALTELRGERQRPYSPASLRLASPSPSSHTPTEVRNATHSFDKLIWKVNANCRADKMLVGSEEDELVYDTYFTLLCKLFGKILK